MSRYDLVANKLRELLDKIDAVFLDCNREERNRLLIILDDLERAADQLGSVVQNHQVGVKHQLDNP